MNTRTETAKPEDMSRAQTGTASARNYLSGRRGLIVLGAIILIAGIALSWSWLVAIGVAPLLIAVAPCAAMCALGLCMKRTGGRSCSNNPQSKEDRDA